ncbi:MAG: NAD(P)-dependent oxidoreductase [Solirubrobacterales bacterium]|nr:NAD(P)-dependent oxidoreductase [Solirubrobacterales bacterium]
MGAAIAPLSTAVSVVGLGPMGAACARALVSDGHAVTVWNRSPERSAPFAAEGGGHVAAGAAEAIAASPLTLVVLSDDAAVAEVLAGPDVRAALAGRVIVNLTSGVPETAAALEQEVRGAGGQYLDGRVGCYPWGIATPNSSIVYAGDRGVFESWAPLLRSLGSDLRHVGDDVRVANVLALAMYNMLHHAVLVAFYEAGAVAQRFGVSLADCVPLARQTLATTADALERGAERVARGDHAAVEAAIDTHAGAVGRTRDAIAAAGAEHAMLDAVVGYLERAQDAGLGPLELSALYDLLADRGEPEPGRAPA